MLLWKAQALASRKSADKINLGDTHIAAVWKFNHGPFSNLHRPPDPLPSSKDYEAQSSTEDRPQLLTLHRDNCIHLELQAQSLIRQEVHRLCQIPTQRTQTAIEQQPEL